MHRRRNRASLLCLAALVCAPRLASGEISTAPVYTTYLGQAAEWSPRGIAVDARGRAVVVGVVAARAVIRKLSANGKTPIFTAFLPGRADGDAQSPSEATAVAVEQSGNVFVTGFTETRRFPATAGAFRASDGFANAKRVAFVTKLSGDTGAILYSSILAAGEGRGIAVDFAGRAWITGTTNHARLLTSPDAFQSVPPATESAFLVELDADGRHVLYSTYLGGPGLSTRANGIAVDPGGNVYVVGTTDSTAFPVRRALQPKVPVASECTSAASDAFVMKFGADHKVSYSTYLGGGCGDEAASVAADLAGNAYVTGRTNSADFPCKHGFQCGTARPPAAFVTKIASDGQSFVYSLLLNGAGGESRGTAIAANQGCAYVTGLTTSLDFPTQGAWPTEMAPVPAGAPAPRLFVAKLTEDGSELVYSTPIARLTEKPIAFIAVGKSGEAYVAGGSVSSSVPAVATRTEGRPRAFVMKLKADSSNDGKMAAAPTK
jgi:hypothetical protein